MVFFGRLDMTNLVQLISKGTPEIFAVEARNNNDVKASFMPIYCFEENVRIDLGIKDTCNYVKTTSNGNEAALEWKGEIVQHTHN